MPRLTIKAINDKIAPHGVELVKGCGYFYFADIGEAFVADSVASVYSAQLNCMSLAAWTDHVATSVAATL